MDSGSDDPADSPTTEWITTPVTEDVLRGHLELERTEHGVRPHRLPAWARAQCADGQLAMAEAQPAGVRLAVRTRATVVELDVLATRWTYRGAPPQPDGVYDLLVDGHLTDQATAPGGILMTADMATGAVETRPGPVGTIRFTGLSPELKDVEIWLPHREITELVVLRSDAPVEAGSGGGRRVWMHHGSSISHGSNAGHPTATWPATAARLGGVELINLGLGGSALLDPFTARVIRDTPADLISVKIGINLVNLDVMRMRAFTPAVHGFLDTIREGHPDTPLLVVSAVYCPIHEDTPGPLTMDFADGAIHFRATGDPAERAAGKLTLRTVRAELQRIVAQRATDDPHLHHLDGLDLYGEADFAELPLPDGLHPDTAAHRRIAEHFAARVFAAGGAFG